MKRQMWMFDVGASPQMEDDDVALSMFGLLWKMKIFRSVGAEETF